MPMKLTIANPFHFSFCLAIITCFVNIDDLGNNTMCVPTFWTEDGDSLFLLNISVYLQVHMASLPRRPELTALLS